MSWLKELAEWGGRAKAQCMFRRARGIAGSGRTAAVERRITRWEQIKQAYLQPGLPTHITCLYTGREITFHGICNWTFTLLAEFKMIFFLIKLPVYGNKIWISRHSYLRGKSFKRRSINGSSNINMYRRIEFGGVGDAGNAHNRLVIHRRIIRLGTAAWFNR